MGGENRELTPEVGFVAHSTMASLLVALGVTTPLHAVCGDLAPSFVRGDRAFNQAAFLSGYRDPGDCRPTHEVICHLFNEIAGLCLDRL